jgi:hypothetical protein
LAARKWTRPTALLVRAPTIANIAQSPDVRNMFSLFFLQEVIFFSLARMPQDCRRFPPMTSIFRRRALGWVLAGEMADAFIIPDHSTRQLGGGRDQEVIGGIAVREIEIMVRIAATDGEVALRRRRNARAIEEALDPSRDRNVEVDPADIDKQRGPPRSAHAEQNGAAAVPASVD